MVEPKIVFIGKIPLFSKGKKLSHNFKVFAAALAGLEDGEALKVTGLPYKTVNSVAQRVGKSQSCKYVLRGGVQHNETFVWRNPTPKPKPTTEGK